MGKNQDSNPGITTRDFCVKKNNLLVEVKIEKFKTHISQSFETIFWVKIRKIFDAVPGILHPGWNKFRSGINIPDPQHCFLVILVGSLGNRQLR
jgi:hypothetical protein